MDRDEQIAEILGEWQERRDRGDHVTPDEVIAAHPDLAPELRSQFAFLGAIDACADGPPAGAPPEIGDFRILRELGRGGMGVVYEAEQVSMQRRVALKVLSLAIAGTPHAVKRFEREARAAGRLHHTNIVPIYAMGQYAGHWYYAMELVQGMPLSKVVSELRAAGAQPREESLARMTPAAEPVPATGTGARSYFIRVAEMFAGVAEALDLAHRENIVHRDIKPSNLLLDAEGILKIVDFGLALQSDEVGPSITMTGDLLGTPAYMSPEQAMAKRIRIDHRTDVYSLGATLYEVLTLRPPFDGKSLQELCSQIVTKDPALPRRVNAKVPRDLETIVLKAMEKDRDRRYQNAAAFARDLRRFAQGNAVEARRIGVATRAWRKVKRHRVASLLVAALLLLGTAGTVLGMRVAEESARRRSLEYVQLCAQGEQALIAGWSESSGGGETAASSPATAFTDAIVLDPDRPEAYLGRYFAPGRSLEEQLADLDAAHACGLSTRSWLLARSGALRDAGRATESGPEPVEAHDERGASPLDAYLEAFHLMSRSRWKDASEAILPVLSSQTTSPSLRYLGLNLRANARSKLGQHSLALEDLICLQAMGDDSAALKALIASAWLQIDVRTAELRFEEVIRQAATSGAESGWLAVGMMAKSRGAYAWAEQAARRGLEAFPRSAHLYGALGEALNLLGRDEEALKAHDRAVEIDPGWAGERSARANVLLELGRASEALAECDRALALDPRCVPALVNRGNAVIHLKRYDEALAAYDSAILQRPQYALAHSNRGAVLCDHLGRPGEALIWFDRAIDLDPDLACAHSSRAAALAKLGRAEEALPSADRAVELDPRHADYHLTRGTVLSDLRRFEEALAAADRALELDPQSARAHYVRGRILQGMRRFEEALAACDRAIGLEPRLANAHVTRGHQLLQLGRPDDALAACDHAIALDESSAGAHLQRGVLLAKLRRFEEALKEMDRAVELDPRLRDAHVGRGMVLCDLARYEEALAAYDRALELPPPAATLHVSRGAILQDHLGRSQDALAAFDRALELDPLDANAHFNRGVALLSLGRVEESRAAHSGAIELEPQNAMFHYNRGYLLALAGRHEEAIASFDRALKLQPSAESHCARGVALFGLRRFAEAVEGYDRSLELDPTNARTHANRGLALQQIRRLEDALAAFERSLELDAANIHVCLCRAIVLDRLDRPRDAVVAYDRTLALDPGNLPSLNNLAWLLATCADESLRDGARAVSLAQKVAVANPNDANSWNTLGVALYRAGKPRDALEALGKSMRLRNGGGATDWFFGAMSHTRLGENEAARKLYDRAVAWTKEHAPEDPELRRFQEEAAGVLDAK